MHGRPVEVICLAWWHRALHGEGFQHVEITPFLFYLPLAVQELDLLVKKGGLLLLFATGELCIGNLMSS